MTALTFAPLPPWLLSCPYTSTKSSVGSLIPLNQLGGVGFGVIAFDEFPKGLVKWWVSADNLHVVVTGVARGDLDLDDAVGEEISVVVDDMEAGDV